MRSARIMSLAGAIAVSCLLLGAATKGPQVGVGGAGLTVGMRSDVGRGGSPGGGTGPWNGFDYALVITADDGYDVNVTRSALIDSFGYAYSLNVSGADTAESGFLDGYQTYTIGQTHEVMSTGSDFDGDSAHNITWGILKYGDRDSIYGELAPQWINNWTDLSVQPRAFVIDGGPMSYEVAEVARNRTTIEFIRGGYWDMALTQSWKPTAPGGHRWDGFRFPNWETPTCIYGTASFEAEAVFGESAEAAAARWANVPTRVDSVLAICAANGNAPAVIVMHGGTEAPDNLVRKLLEYAKSRGDIWITDYTTMMDYWKARSVPVDAPHWAPYAQIDGITAADSIFWGPEPATYTANGDSFIIHNGNTSASKTGKTQITSGTFATGWLNSSAPTNAGTFTGNIDARANSWPGNSIAVFTFPVDSLVTEGKVVAEARLYFYNGLVADFSDTTTYDEKCYYAAIGVTDPDLLVASASTSMCWNYSSGTTPWGTDMATYYSAQQYGDYISARNDAGFTAFSIRSFDVSEYVRHAVENGYSHAMFMMTGYSGAATIFRVRGHDYSTASSRPYLIVKTQAD